MYWSRSLVLSNMAGSHASSSRESSTGESGQMAWQENGPAEQIPRILTIGLQDLTTHKMPCFLIFEPIKHDRPIAKIERLICHIAHTLHSSIDLDLVE